MLVSLQKLAKRPETDPSQPPEEINPDENLILNFWLPDNETIVIPQNL